MAWAKVRHMGTLLRRLVADEDGQDLVEYALLCATIALTSIVAVSALGTLLRNIFITVAGQLAQ
jgi:Flp pilus assembly pilin Flp